MPREFFTPEERQILLSFVEASKDTFNNPSTTLKTIEAKANVWKKITEDFNDDVRTSQTPRTEQQLRDFLKRLKIQAKKEVSTYKKALQATGGGQPPPEPSEWVATVERIFPQLTKELECPFDSDASTINLESVPGSSDPPEHVIGKFIF